MPSDKKIIELEQKVVDLKASLATIQKDNGIWDRVFTESYWGMVVCDAESLEILKVNPTYAKMHGYGLTELLGRTVHEVYSPESLKELPDILARIHLYGHSAYNTVHLRKDGSRFPVHTDSYEVEIEGRRLISVSIWDVTELEQNQKELALYRESLEELVKSRTEDLERTNEKLQIEMIGKETAEKDLAKANQEMINTLESISDGFIAVNHQWVITYANEAIAKALTGRGLDGKLVGTVFGFADWQRNHQMFWDSCQEVMVEGVRKRFEFYSNLMEHWLECSIYPTANGISIFFRYIDERKKLGKVVEEEHLRLYTLFNAFPGLIYIIEENNKIRFANHNFKKIFGDCEGQFCHTVVAGSSSPCQDCAKETRARDSVLSRSEYLYNHRLYEVYTQPYTDVDGTRLYFAVLIDITERKNADREYLRLERLNMVGEMAAGIAHEVRNPLTTVRGFLQLLSTKDIPQQYSDYYKIMIEELDRANLIITDFLSLAREKSLDFTLVNLAKIVNSLMPLLSADALNHDKEITLELEPVSDIEGDENELRQLLLNLARNGFEAMGRGGVLTIITLETDNYVILKISDQGGGLDPYVLERLGTPFLTTKEGGTGLGLAICQNIAVRHNALMEFASDTLGTTVSIKFPSSKKVKNHEDEIPR
ncbi:PAS domain S-box [Desulfosporosinus acidiphilus SJ4]|uniref:histidine kinase n=1 Tax=Desulfosporosinus acidiphilus (strain DSM 22704 / JCM 16185 / SJ4) TaxID=646529 RepID=I4D2E6_DESAJ|nr:PAS domain S-box protein [Desulfosporosinus acidiphilus]AFM39970.1 PAS domain S-box [Desulfosporosinus acidiphilus SJ4]